MHEIQNYSQSQCPDSFFVFSAVDYYNLQHARKTFF